jgi:hypothetical protein
LAASSVGVREVLTELLDPFDHQQGDGANDDGGAQQELLTRFHWTDSVSAAL